MQFCRRDSLHSFIADRHSRRHVQGEPPMHPLPGRAALLGGLKVRGRLVSALPLQLRPIRRNVQSAQRVQNSSWEVVLREGCTWRKGAPLSCPVELGHQLGLLVAPAAFVLPHLHDGISLGSGSRHCFRQFKESLRPGADMRIHQMHLAQVRPGSVHFPPLVL